MIWSFDLETELIRPGVQTPKPICYSYASDDVDICGLDAASAIPAFLIPKLEAGEHIVGANIAFDFSVALAAYPELTDLVFQAYQNGQIHDVQIRQALDAIANGHLYLNPDKSKLRDPETGKVKTRYSLAICAKLCLGETLQKADTWRLRYAELADIPIENWPPEAKQYAISDAVTTLRVFEAQKDFRNLHNEAAQCMAALALRLMAVRAIKTDPQAVKAFTERVSSQYEVDQKRFKELKILREDGSCDTKYLKELVTKAYQGKPPMTDPTDRYPEGQVKTDVDTLDESGDPVLEEYAGTSKTRKLNNTYLPFLEEGTVYGISANWNVLVESGRTSCAFPNLQNLPRSGGVKDCVIARDGMVFGFADYSAVELSTLAQSQVSRFGKSALGDLINSGVDPHCSLAAQMANKSYSDVVAAVKAGEKWAEDMRYAAKAGSFGFPGGMGVPKFVLSKRKEGLSFCQAMGRAELGTCGSEMLVEWNRTPCSPICKACAFAVKDLKEQWFALFPEMRLHFDYVSRMTSSGAGELEQLFSKRIRGGCGYCDGANDCFQGLAADMAKDALWAVTKECHTQRKSPLWNCRPLIFEHDSIGTEMVVSRASEALDRQIEIMEEVGKKWCPDVRVKAEGALSFRWYKGAKALRVNGKLVPVKPYKVGDKTTWVEDTCS